MKKEIEEDSKNKSLKNNEEFSLTNSESSNEYFSVASDVISLTTIHLNDESSEYNESEISDDFDGTGRYNSEQQSASNIQEHPKETINREHENDIKRTHENCLFSELQL